MSIALGKRVGWLLLAIGLTVAGVAVARVAMDVRSAAGALPNELRMARAEGLAVEPSELMLRVDAKDNAAPIYRQAILAFDKKPYSETNRRLEALGRFLAEGEDAGLARSSLDKWAKCIELAEEASRKPRCDFQPLWQEGAGREPEDLKPFVKLLGARAILNGKVEDLEAARRVAAHAGSMPTVGSAIAKVEAERVWLDACWRFASVRSHDPSALLAVRQMVGRTEYPYLGDCLRGELVLARSRVRRLTFKPDSESTNLDLVQEDAGNIGGNEVAVEAADCRLIQLYRRLNASLPTDPQNWDAVTRAYEVAAQDAGARFSARLNPYLLPDLADAAKKCKRLEARAAAIDMALEGMMRGPSGQETVRISTSA